MSQPEAKRTRTGSTDEATGNEQLSPESKRKGKELTFLALHLTDDKVAWVIYHDKNVANQGLADVDNSVGLVDSLQEVSKEDGFAVAFKLDKALLVWFHDVLSDEEYDMWKKIKKCQLYNFDLYVLIDEDCYEFWSLSQLHAELYQDEDARRESADRIGSAQLVGEAFHWFATRYEDKVLAVRFRGDLEKGIQLGLGLHSPAKMKERATWLRSGQQWDTAASTDREPPKNMKYIAVDVETHDWAERKVSRQSVIGRIVEIAWIAYNNQGNEIESKQYLLRPHGYESISTKAKRYHGISTRCARERGSDASLVFAEFTSLLRKIPDDGFVIAHNMEHEDSIFFTNLNEEGRDVWESAPKCDTFAKSLLAYLPESYSYLRNKRHGVALSELHRIVSPIRSVFGAHSALADVRMTWDIFRYYQKAIAEKEGTGARLSLEWDRPLPPSDPFEPFPIRCLKVSRVSN